MGVSGKTRKALWGRAGNRCTICRCLLSVGGSSDTGGPSIIGEECHIRSRRPAGPRHEADYPQSRLDAYENLLLLCPAHHKQADEQIAKFTSPVLEALKCEHEHWVLSSTEPARPATQSLPRGGFQGAPVGALVSVPLTPADVLDAVSSAHLFIPHTARVLSSAQAALSSEFLKFVRFLADVSLAEHLEDRPMLQEQLGGLLQRAEALQLSLFMGHEVRTLTLGDVTVPLSTLHLGLASADEPGCCVARPVDMAVARRMS
jgi:hypothetical protein